MTKSKDLKNQYGKWFLKNPNSNTKRDLKNQR